MEYFYIFPINEKPWFKLGITVDINERMKTHKREFGSSGLTFDFDKVIYCEAPNGKPKKAESMLRDMFPPVRGLETFHVDHLEDAKAFIEQWAQRIGFSKFKQYSPEKKKRKPKGKKSEELERIETNYARYYFSLSFDEQVKEHEFIGEKFHHIKQTPEILSEGFTGKVQFSDAEMRDVERYRRVLLSYPEFNWISLKETDAKIETRKRLEIFIENYNELKQYTSPRYVCEGDRGVSVYFEIEDLPEYDFDRYSELSNISFKHPNGGGVNCVVWWGNTHDEFSIHFTFDLLSRCYPDLWELVPHELKNTQGIC